VKNEAEANVEPSGKLRLILRASLESARAVFPQRVASGYFETVNSAIARVSATNASASFASSPPGLGFRSRWLKSDKEPLSTPLHSFDYADESAIVRRETIFRSFRLNAQTLQLRGKGTGQIWQISRL